MTKIKILKVLNEDEVSRNGKSYTKCSVKTLDKNNQEVWLNGFGNATTKNWVKGQVVELDVYQEEYNGKNYLKFREVKERNIFEVLDEIVLKLDFLLVKAPTNAQTTQNTQTTTQARQTQPTPQISTNSSTPEEINPEDIPF